MASILGKVVDVLVTACGYFVVEIAPTCQLSGWRLLGDPSVDSILFVTRPIHGICADCIQSSMLPGPEQEAARIVTSLLYLGKFFGFSRNFRWRFGVGSSEIHHALFFEEIESASILFDHIIPLPNH